MRQNKKGMTPLKVLVTSGITLTVIIITFTVLSLIVGDLQTTAETQTSNVSHAYNITGEGGSAIFELADWLPLIALVIAAAIIVGIVIYHMGVVGE